MYIRMKFIIVVVLCLFPFLQSSAQLRQNLLLDQEWEFRSDKDGNNLTWEKVTVPHTWNATDGLTPDYYRGTGEYRYHLNILPEMLKQRAFLRFEAVSQVADVFVNGIPVGRQPYRSKGFQSFRQRYRSPIRRFYCFWRYLPTGISTCTAQDLCHSIRLRFFGSLYTSKQSRFQTGRIICRNQSE